MEAVNDQAIRMMGAVVGAVLVIRKWRKESDCGRTFSGRWSQLFGFLLEEFEGRFIMTHEAAHPDPWQHIDF